MRVCRDSATCWDTGPFLYSVLMSLYPSVTPNSTDCWLASFNGDWQPPHPEWYPHSSLGRWLSLVVRAHGANSTRFRGFLDCGASGCPSPRRADIDLACLTLMRFSAPHPSSKESLYRRLFNDLRLGSPPWSGGEWEGGRGGLFQSLQFVLCSSVYIASANTCVLNENN